MINYDSDEKFITTTTNDLIIVHVDKICAFQPYAKGQKGFVKVSLVNAEVFNITFDHFFEVFIVGYRTDPNELEKIKDELYSKFYEKHAIIFR